MRFEIQGLTFGGPTDSIVVTNVDRSAGDVRTQYVDRPRADGVMVGRDYLGQRIWTIEATTNGADIHDSLTLAAELERIWRSPARLVPGALMELRYEIGGRWRAVYGRCGQFAGVSGDVLSHAGAARLQFAFVQTDPLHYDIHTNAASLSIIPATVGGLVTPIVAPVSTLRYSTTDSRFITVGGDAPAPLSVAFNGPVTNPAVFVDGQEVGLSGTLAYDESVTIDSHSSTVLHNSGASRAGQLTRKTRIDYLRLAPGTHEVSFTGMDSTGTASVDLKWQSASYSL